MTYREFILRLCEASGTSSEDVFLRGRKTGWLEAEDEIYKDRPILRKQIARILHMYLLKVKGIPDLKDLSRAHALRDLYDCRVCANHVAQVYSRGIMDAKNLMKDGEFLWFDLDGEDDEADISSYIDRMLMTE